MAQHAQSPEAWLEAAIQTVCDASDLRVIPDGWSRKTYHIHINSGPRTAAPEVARLESGFFQDPVIYVEAEAGQHFVSEFEAQLNSSDFKIEFTLKPLPD